MMLTDLLGSERTIQELTKHMTSIVERPKLPFDVEPQDGNPRPLSDIEFRAVDTVQKRQQAVAMRMEWEGSLEMPNVPAEFMNRFRRYMYVQAMWPDDRPSWASYYIETGKIE